MWQIWKDIAVSLRQFRRSPGMAASVAVTIGLGVGASLAIFGLLHDTLIGQSPFRNPDGLVVIENTGRYYYGDRQSEGLASPYVSGPDYADIEAQTRALSAVGASAQASSVMTGGDRPRPVWRTLVSPGLLTLLEPQPRLGRLLQPSDFKAGSTPAAVLTESMWRRHFASDPNVIGRMIRLDDQAFTVVGVVSDSVLRFLVQPSGLLDRVQNRQVISPLLASMVTGREAAMFKYVQSQRDAAWLSVFGRLAPRRTVEAASSEMSLVAGRLAREHPATNAGRSFQLRGFEEWRTAEVRGTTTMLLVAALLLFLVASCNAAGLVLAESVRHETEMAVRQALGAGSVHLIRLEFLRSIVLALPGGVLALALAAATLLAVDRTLADGSGTIVRTLFLPRVLLAGVGITVLAGVLAGAGAAWSLRRRNVAETLKEGGLTASAGRRRRLATRVLVALQVAAATTLVLGAGLMLRSVWNIVGVPLGFDVHRSLVIQVRLPSAHYPKGGDQRAFFLQALRRVRALPSVTSAGVAITAPLTNTSSSASGIVLELPSSEKREPQHINIQSVTPGYLEALDMKLLRGRWFTESDYTGGQPPVLVNEAFCRKYFTGVDPLQVRVQWRRRFVPIVGVVADVRQSGPLAPPEDMLYMMESFERPAPWAYIVVRTAGAPAPAGRAVLREVLATDPTVSTEDPQLVSDLFTDTFAARRRLLFLLGSAAAIVLLLTAFSLVSALGQFIAAQAREIAIRLALGAESRHVVALMCSHLAVALALGLAAGAATGLALAHTLLSQLFGITPTDPWTFAETLATLGLLAVAASIGPVLRAIRIDPARTLKAQ